MAYPQRRAAPPRNGPRPAPRPQREPGEDDESPQEETPRNKPVHIVKFGLVRGMIWSNDTDKGVRFNVTLNRLYKAQNGDWMTSHSYGFNDLPLAEKVLAACFEWIAAAYAEADAS